MCDHLGVMLLFVASLEGGNGSTRGHRVLSRRVACIGKDIDTGEVR